MKATYRYLIMAALVLIAALVLSLQNTGEGQRILAGQKPAHAGSAQTKALEHNSPPEIRQEALGPDARAPEIFTHQDAVAGDVIAPVTAQTQQAAAPSTKVFTASDDQARSIGESNRPSSIKPTAPGQRAKSARPQPRHRAVADILAGADLSMPSVRARVVEEMKMAEKLRYAAVLERAAELGIPVRKEGPGHQVAILHDIRGEEPLYRKTMNANAAISSAANLVYPSPYSLSGSGVKVGVWDAGSVLATHQEFNGRVINRDSVATDDHATHVAGTIASAGVVANAKGMAPAVNVDSYDWNDDYAEMTATGAATSNETSNIPISNHSYGYNAGTADMGVYETEARSTDAIAHDLPYYLIYWAAGNDQDYLTDKGGYQSITFNGLAKNIMTIGAVNDAVSGGVRSLAAATMSTFSSWGPADDGRIKPDLVANGVNLNSPVNSGNTAYDSYSGTSMATPSAAGSSALLAQLYKREFGGKLPRASTLKALLIHTADDLGNNGPDYRNGWGLINTKAAADVILEHSAFGAVSPRIIEDTVTSGAPARTYTFGWDGSSPVRTTLVWTDPEGPAQSGSDSRTPVLVNNLDMRITAPNGSTVYLPYVMPFVGNWSTAAMSTPATTGDNNVDNVERIDINTPNQAGTYTVTVRLDGTLTGSAQTFSLVIGGRADTDQPPLLAPLDDLIVVNGRSVNFNVVASDPADADPITLTAANQPAGASFNATGGTGTFSWASATPNGAYTPRFIASDKDGATTQTVTITVMNNEPPVIAALDDRITIISNLMTFAVTATDPVGNDPVTLNASNLPSGATFSASGGNGTFTWANPAPVGVYNVSFIASDLSGASTQTVYLTVEPEPVYTYATNSAAINLPDASTATPYPSTITINGVEGIIRNVALTLHGFTHAYPSDMSILLVGPKGQKAVVMGEVGGSTGVSNLTMTFDDRAESETSFVLESGTFKPSGTIAEAMPAPAPGLNYPVTFTNFIGGSPNGTWSLYAYDPYDLDAGEISRGWSLQVQVIILTNQPPVFSVTEPGPVPVGSDFELTVTANDLTDHDLITLSADSLPPGATFIAVTNRSTATGTMVWNNAGPTGSYTAVFRAIDNDGTSTRSMPIDVFLPPPPAPDGLRASATNNNGFTATWNNVAAADSYRLDVSTNAAFELASDVGEPESYFYHGGTPGSGTGGTWIEENVSGTTYLIMTDPASRVTAPTIFYEEAIAEALTFQARTYGGSGNPANVITVSISTDGGVNWSVLGTRTPPNNTLASVAPFDMSAYANQAITLRFETLAATGSIGAGIRQVELNGITYNVVPDYLPGYSNLNVAATSATVSGLTPAQTYYFRARAVNSGGTSSNSATASVTTTFSPEPPVFTSSAGPFTNQTGIAFTLPVAASGLPAPTMSLASSTASGGFSFTNNALSYIPPLADIGIRTFTLIASNDSGSATQVVTVVVTAGPPPPPAEIWASATNSTDFTAAWSSVAGATSYRLDVSENTPFANESPGGGGTEPFTGIGGGTTSQYLTRTWTNNGVVWTAFKARTDQTINSDAICLRNESGAYFISGTITGGIDTLSIVSQQKFTGSGGTFDVFVNDVKVGSALPIYTTVTTHSISNIGVTGDFTLMFTNSGTVRPAFDDLTWAGPGSSSGAYVPGYSNLIVNGTSQLVTGLAENSTYYFRTRAANDAGEGGNSSTGSVTTSISGEPPPTAPSAPAAIRASFTNATEFIAAWSAVGNAEGYRLDVATNESFSAGGGDGGSITEPFSNIGGGTTSSYLTRTWTNNGIVWTALKSRVDQTINGSAVCLRNESGSYLSSGTITGGIDTLSVTVQQKFSGSGGTFDILVNDIRIGAAIPITTDVVTHSISNIGIGGSFTLMITNSGAVRPAFDDLTWTSAGGSSPSFVPGYEDRTVVDTSQSVTGLTEGVTYYFRARAVNAVGTSPNSPTGSVVTVADSGGGDMNNDGIPDDWFAGYGLSPTNEASAMIPGADVTYGEAFMYDVNPGAPPVGFNETQGMEMMPSAAMNLTINPSSTGRLYDVFWRTDLGSTNWSGFGLDVPGTGGEVTLTVTNDPALRFYRTGVKMRE